MRQAIGHTLVNVPLVETRTIADFQTDQPYSRIPVDARDGNRYTPYSMTPAPIAVRRVAAVCALFAAGLCAGWSPASATVDLRIRNLSAECGANSINLSITFENAGTSHADAFAIALYASADATIDTTDYLLARTSIAGLAALSSDTLSGIVGLPSVIPGMYTIGALIDVDGAVAESNEANNVHEAEALALPCLHGLPDIHIARPHITIGQPVAPARKQYNALPWSPSHTIVRIDAAVPATRARALLNQAGARVIDYEYLPPNSFLIEDNPRVLERLNEVAQVVAMLPASRAIENGEPTMACPVDDPPAKYAARGTGWDGPGRGSALLHYFIDDARSGVAPSDFRTIFERALNEWGTYADLVFEESSRRDQPRTIDVQWASGNHGDGTPFDGVGGVVAHSFYPHPIAPEPLAGDLHIDTAETWSVTPGSGLSLYSVVLHELGHCLGLGHSDDPRAVMYPQIHYAQVFDGLAADDIDGILSLYAPAPEPNAFNIHNAGTNLLVIDAITTDVPASWMTTFPAAPFTIPPGATQDVQVAVNFAMAPRGTTTRRLLIYSNDSDKSPFPDGVFVEVTATGDSAPSTVIAPPSSVLTRQGPVTIPVAFPGADEVLLRPDALILNTTGTAHAQVEMSLTGGISDRLVTLYDVTGDGTLSLTVPAGMATNAFGSTPAAVTSATITVDNTPPSVVLMEPTFDAQAHTVRVGVEYHGAAAIALAPNHVVLSAASADASIDVDGSGAARRDIVLRNITGDGAMAITIVAGTAQDAAGNLASAPGAHVVIDVDGLDELPPAIPGNGTVGCHAGGEHSPWRSAVYVAILALLRFGRHRQRLRREWSRDQ